VEVVQKLKFLNNSNTKNCLNPGKILKNSLPPRESTPPRSVDPTMAARAGAD
jgi:hypothetical protein